MRRRGTSRCGPLFAPREAADLLREGLPLIGFMVVGLLYCRADGVILSLLSSHSEVGVYGLALTIAFNTIVVSLIFLKSTLSTSPSCLRAMLPGCLCAEASS